ncbi:hypothetical protein [Spirosoma lituiforme]
MNSLRHAHKSARRLSVGDTLFSESSWDVLFVTITAVTETEALSDRGYRFYRTFSDGDSHINGQFSPSWDFLHWVVVP